MSRHILIPISCLVMAYISCSRVMDKPYVKIEGSTMGTYYKVNCDCHVEGLQKKIDSLLVAINDQVSTYIDTSLISEINKSSGLEKHIIGSSHFSKNLENAIEWYHKSDGFLDVSIMPLVNYWGFGYGEKKAVPTLDSNLVDSLMTYVGLDKWKLENGELEKMYAGQELDFSSLAKGYAVDEIGVLLQEFGCRNYLIDIGGELLAKGVNDRGAIWLVGISKPEYHAAPTDVQVLIRLDNMALASSGNYRNYHERDGVKYGHTLNPKTGYPYQDQLLAVSILMKSCSDADAVATACMAMGYTKATTFIEKMPEIGACFLYGADDGTIQTKYLNGFIQYVGE